MNYCLYASPAWVIQSYGLRPDLKTPITPDKLPRILHSGLTNWPRALGGVFDQPQLLDDIAKYDVIHANMSPSMVKNVFKLRRLINLLPEGKRPLLVVNPDHAMEMWDTFQRFDIFIEALNQADRVFTVHPTMSSTLGVLLDRKVYTITHPTDVDTLRAEYDSTKKHPENIVLVVAHAYDQNYLIVTETLKAMQRAGHKFRAVLVGHMTKDPMGVAQFYDEIFDAMPFDKLMGLVAMSKCVIDTAFTHSYGRIGVECAALGVPVIGGMNNASICRMGRMIDIYNADEIKSSVVAYLNGEAIDVGAVVDCYNYANSAAAFTEMCNG